MNDDLLQVAGIAVLRVLLGLLSVAGWIGLLYGLYFLMSLPLRRRERERCFLDFLETALARGQAPEQALARVASSPDRVFGRRLRRLAWYLAGGMPLSAALSITPGIVSARTRLIFEAGEAAGDVRRVLPACRATLSAAQSQATAAMNYLILLPMLLGPGAALLAFVGTMLVPKFREIFADLVEGPLPPLTQFVFDHYRQLAALCWSFGLSILLLSVCYAAGPWFRRKLPGKWRSMVDGALSWLPWRRWRTQRDFSQVLAALLDAEVPENEALRRAAAATDNAAFAARAERALARLREGVPLTDAVAELDATGELRWRLANALRQSGRFLDALNGWHEALDARAYRAEQTAAQLMATGFVVLNGVYIGVIAVAVFQALLMPVVSLALW